MGSLSPHLTCFFLKESGDDFIMLLVYVDDVLIASSSSILIDEVKRYLHDCFTIKALGLANYFLGVEIIYSNTGITLNQ